MDEGGPKKRQSRQERLEAELRENLRRRKEQARARARSHESEDPAKPARPGKAD